MYIPERKKMINLTTSIYKSLVSERTPLKRFKIKDVRRHLTHIIYKYFEVYEELQVKTQQATH